jgi:hypothetical protein
MAKRQAIQGDKQQSKKKEKNGAIGSSVHRGAAKKLQKLQMLMISPEKRDQKSPEFVQTPLMKSHSDLDYAWSCARGCGFNYVCGSDKRPEDPQILQHQLRS